MRALENDAQLPNPRRRGWLFKRLRLNNHPGAPSFDVPPFTSRRGNSPASGITQSIHSFYDRPQSIGCASHRIISCLSRSCCAMCHGRLDGVPCDLPVGCMPRGLFIDDQHRLRRFVPDAKALFHFVGDVTILNNQNQPTGNRGIVLLEGLKVFNHPRTSRTLRAMLEKQNRFMLRPLQKFLEILFFAQFDDHEFRLPDAR